MDFKALSDKELDIVKKTISHQSTYWLIQDALFKHEGASFLRFADGEYQIIKDAQQYSGKFRAFGDEWNGIYGLLDLDIQLLKNQLVDAGNNCRYLAPSISGIWNGSYSGWNYFNSRTFYIENFFPYGLTNEQINIILTRADGIAYVIRDGQYANTAREHNRNAKIVHIPLSSYKDIPRVKEDLITSNCQLVLLSGGPIGKVLGPIIEKMGKVCLDIGSAMHRWI